MGNYEDGESEWFDKDLIDLDLIFEQRESPAPSLTSAIYLESIWEGIGKV